ncbi:MAG: type II 3-dehydroquinate dehydratase [Tepidanaerobacteraceae bacterium]
MHIKIINGANLNMLGVRNKNIYGCSNLQDINREIASKAREIGVVVSFFQSNDEGKIIDEIHNCIDNCDGIIINPGGYTHYSISIRDAIESVPMPVIEVHLSNIFSRDDFRRNTVTGEKAVGIIAGFGATGYWLAVLAINDLLNKRENLGN